MSGWTDREVRSVKLIHYSTSSSIKIEIKNELQVEEGGPFEEFTQEIWLDYSRFSDLKKAINLTDFP